MCVTWRPSEKAGSVGLGWGLQLCIPIKLTGTHAIGPQATLSSKGLLYMQLKKYMARLT